MQIVKKYSVGFVLIALVLAASVLIYIKLHPKKLPPNLIEATGRIDGDLTNINAKYPGRVVQMNVDDGMAVHKGMLIAKLDDTEMRAQEKALKKQIEAKQKELEAKKIELAITKKRLRESLNKAASAVKTAKLTVNEAQKQLASQKALVKQDRRDLKRAEDLYKKKLLQKEALEKAQLKFKVDSHTLEALDEKLQQAREALSIAKSDYEEAKAIQKKADALAKGIEALQKGIEALQASKERIEAMREQMTLRSPFDGYVVEKVANEGEVVGAGMSVATLIAPSSLYLKVFVDTLQNGKVKLHDKAVIFLDAAPNTPIEAEVSKIAQNAEFTPKEVSVRSDRIQRVFAVYLKPLHPDPLLKLGLPAIGVISIDGKGLPHSLDDIPVL